MFPSYVRWISEPCRDRNKCLVNVRKALPVSDGIDAALRMGKIDVGPGAFILLLDLQGRVLSLNRGWEEQATRLGLLGSSVQCGQCYATHCAATGHQRKAAQKLVRGLESVLSTNIDTFSVDCPAVNKSLTERFRITVSRVGELVGDFKSEVQHWGD